MKTNQETHYIEKIGGGQEQEFKIKASAASFQILSSGLYSNKIRAICRELFCNALDSHVEAGNKDIPFDVKLPTYLDPVFTIKDYGTGLSHEQVMTIYTTYFHSTKSDSDDFIGQLGLGSKSPFSYTNQFIVESRQNGMSNVYSMHINESGTPAVSHMGTSATDEKNGLTIKIAVKNNDFYKFQEETENTLTYFSPYPNVDGHHTRREFDYMLKKNGWAIRNHQSSSGLTFAPQVIQGVVCYPIDTNQLMSYSSEEVFLSEGGIVVISAPIDLFVPIGAVQVAPSREHLSYDKRTIENLIRYVNQVAVELTTSLREYVSSAESLWDARVIACTFASYDSVFRKLYEKLINNKTSEFDYEGVKVSPFGFDLTDLDIEHTSLTYYRRNHKNTYSRERMISTQAFPPDIITHYKTAHRSNQAIIPVNNNFILCVNDVRIGSTKIRQYIKEFLNVGQGMLEIKPHKKGVDNSAEVSQIITTLGIPSDKVVYTSDLEEQGHIEKKERTVNVVDRSKKPIFEKRSRNGHCDAHSWSRGHVDNFEDGGYYVKYYNGKWVDSHTHQRSKPYLAMFVNNLIREGVLEKDVQIVGFNSIDYKKYSKDPKWVDITDVIETYIETNKEAIADHHAKHMSSNNILYGNMKNNLIELANHLEEGHEIVSFVAFNQEVSEMKTKTPFNYNGLFFPSEKMVKIFEEINFLIATKEVKVDPTHIFKKYPLVELFAEGQSYINSKFIDHIVEYVKRIDIESSSEVEVDNHELKVV